MRNWLPRETLEVDGEKVLWTEETPTPQMSGPVQPNDAEILTTSIPGGQGKQPSRLQVPRGATRLQLLSRQRRSPYSLVADALK